MTKPVQILFLSSVFALASCTRTPAAAPPFQPVASIQDVMQSLVDPAADALWESVSSETTASGTEEKQPRTDAQWRAVRHHAIALQEAGNLLMIGGRPVTHGGRVTEDAHVPGVSTPEEIRQAIETSPDAFHAGARAMQNAATEAVHAIDARSPSRLLAAGAKLDQACEKCHSQFWYPSAGGPPAQWPAPLKTQP